MVEDFLNSMKLEPSILREIPIEALKPGLYQPRKNFPQEDLQSLSETISMLGVLEPLIVRPSLNNKFEIIAGERRWRAAKMAKLKTVPCLVRPYSDEKASQIALIENINRQNLNPIEEAKGISRITEEFDYTHEEMSAILGKPRSYITNLLRLLKLDERVQGFIRTGELSESHAKILAGISFEKQYFFADQCVQKMWSSRKLDTVIKLQYKPLKGKLNESKDINIKALELKISDCFGHPIKICFTKEKSGSLSINFANLDDLQNVLEKLGYKEI